MGFDAGWLDLREPVDAASRDISIIGSAAIFLGEVPAPLAVDLGCGTGASLRAFASQAPADLRWRLIDNDAGLLAIAAERCGPGVEVVACDLADPAGIPLDGARLVTASALLDLVSVEWIEALAARVVATGAGFHASLIYNGMMSWTRELPEDGEVVRSFNLHQRRDKGFGPALGPAAADAAAAAFSRRGYGVRRGDSVWRLEPEHTALEQALVDGIAAAAAEMGCAGAAAWAQARRAASGDSACIVGHTDLLALPSGARAQSNMTSPPSP